MVASPALGRRSRTLSLSSSRRGVTIGAAAAAGIAFRVWTYRSALGIPDSDEAVVGLMAHHILHGQFTTFFWGQWYGGSQEALLTAPLFFLFGSSWLLLRLLPMILDGVAALVLWRVGRRTIGEPAAAAAAAVFWTWPPFVIYKLTHQWGFYASGVLYCALILLLALRLIEQPTRTRAGVFGLVLGLALWQSAQLVPIVLPVIAWTIWKRRQWLRHLWLTIPLAVLGAL
ncbi:MAG: glycosyltransferase family 39 protein, partial [Gaiellaceae bacterium]